jgi:hypothetical protein
MHSPTGVPITTTIPIVQEPGKLAGSARTGAAPRSQPSAAAFALDASFRARLQTMFAASSRMVNTPESKSRTEPAIPETQDSSSRGVASTLGYVPARSAPMNSPRASFFPPPPMARVLSAIPSEAAQKPAMVVPESAPSTSSARSQRAIRETSPQSGAPVASSTPPPVPHFAALPQALAAPSPAPVSQVPDSPPPSLSPHHEDDIKPSLVRPADSAVGTDVATSAPDVVSIPPSSPSHEHSAPFVLPQATAAYPAVTPAMPAAKSDRVPAPRHDDAPTMERATAPTLEPAAAPAPTPGVQENPRPTPPSSPPEASASALDSQEDSHSAQSPRPPAAPVAAFPVEHTLKSQPALAAAPTPVPFAMRNPTIATASQRVPIEESPASAKAESYPRASNAATSEPSLPVQHPASPVSPGIASVHAPILVAARQPANPAGPVISPHADAFAALDAEPAAPPATWNYAGPTHAEAGYLDSSLGWVAVRADAAGNTLHAAIVPSSSEAAQALGSHLDGLNTYLADHRVAAAQLTIATPQSSQSFAGHADFTPSGQQTGQEQRDGQPAMTPRADSTTPHATNVSTPSIAGWETPAAPVWSGGHISVIA